MRYQQTVLNEEKRTHYRKRLLVALLTVIILLITVATYIGYLQIVRFDAYHTRAEDNRIKVQPIPPPRGRIFDRNGVILADNKLIRELVINPSLIKDMDKTIETLTHIVTMEAETVESLRNTLSRQRNRKEVTVYSGLNDREIAEFSVIRYQFPEFSVQTSLQREYPNQSSGAHVTGYVGRISENDLNTIQTTTNYLGSTHIGKTGIEKQYEHLLHGDVGYREVEINKFGNVVRTLNEYSPTPGTDLFLTIDSRLQRFAEQLLGSRLGAIVLLDNSEGEVLVMASMPSYNPNYFVEGLSQRNFNTLMQSDNSPLLNRAINGQYPPGSTLKPFVALAGLEAQKVTADHTEMCPGYYQLDVHDGSSQQIYRDWKRGGHGIVNAQSAIAQSCDVYFYALARELGINMIHDYLSLFHLGRITGIDLPGESAGNIPSTAWKRRTLGQSWFLGETIIAGIGQGYMLSTPLQLTTSTAVLANRGRDIVPTLLHAVRRPDDSTIHRIKHTPADTDITQVNASNWEVVIAGMQDVVASRKGTANHLSAGIWYPLAGKTGTAQVVSLSVESDNERLRDHAIFTAFTPVDKPAVTVAVVVENGGSGSAVAAPIARRLLDQYYLYQQNDVTRTTTGTD